jgi:hypothetical protein
MVATETGFIGPSKRADRESDVPHRTFTPCYPKLLQKVSDQATAMNFPNQFQLVGKSALTAISPALR